MDHLSNDNDVTTELTFPDVHQLFLGEELTEGVDHDAFIKQSIFQYIKVAQEALREGKVFMCLPVSQDGAFQGSGMRMQPDGVIMTGHFEHDCNNVTAAHIFTYNHETIDIRCNIINGKIDGRDAAVSLPGLGKYAGSIVDGIAHGTGVLVRPNGTWYEGQWKMGKRHGNGTEHYTDDHFYKGEWQEDTYNGQGELCTFNSTYIGQWQCGLKSGKGIVTEVCEETRVFHVEYNQGTEIRRQSQEQLEIARLQAELQEVRCNSNSTADRNTKDNRERDSALCKICFTKPVSVVLRPCNHACICDTCETKLVNQQRDTIRRVTTIKCPVCRRECHQTEKIILS